MNELLFLTTTFFARAGGGGSSSGSGGGIIFALPAIAAGAVATFVKKKTGSKAAGISVGYAAALLASLPYLAGGWFIFALAVIGGFAGATTGAFFDKLSKFRAGNQRAQLAVQQAAQTDPAWDQAAIINYTTTVFNRFQYDWGRMDLASIQQYTTPEYAKHIGLMLYAMQQMGRQNIMSDITINEALITNAYDDANNNNNDQVSVGFAARARDVLLDTTTGNELTVNSSEFGEQWNFVRKDDSWLLYGIDQGTEDETMLVASLKTFAAQNDMYFSPDWGNLLLPARGQLFKQGFKNTDINNHVIGFWQGNLLVQLYTYAVKNSDTPTYYMIGQVNLPKSYGGIIVERRGGLLGGRVFAPKGYQKISLEWGNFNKRYNVYATDMDKVTSFELLNPSFMAWLYDQNIKVNIEVVDNVVYLYARISAKENRYADMMEILRRSHKELKL